MLQIGDTFQDGGAVFKVKKFGADGALVGSVTWYAGAGTPENYLLCDGSAVSRKDYADLFAVIVTTYGAGDGSTTFNLPLLTDNRFIEGSDVAGTQHEAGLPNITGAFGGAERTSASKYGRKGAFDYEGYTSTFGWGSVSSDHAANNVVFDASKSSAIYGKSIAVQPTALSLRPIIKYI